MSEIRTPRKGLLAAFLAIALVLLSGCALLLVGGGAAGGYMIRKGEEGGDSKKESSEPAKKSLLPDELAIRLAFLSDALDGQRRGL